MERINLNDVSLQFRVRQQGRVSLKDFVVKGLFRKKRNPYVHVHALKHLNLSFKDGERVGVIGHNGAGKSTLLRLLAGIYPPTSGEISVRGKISSVLDIGVGVESEATGWDNIAYRSYLQGAHPSQVLQKQQEIADFSELGDAIDKPVRTYSSGMMVRLMFSIATTIEPEILLVDEVLSTGDLGFVEKARLRMLDLIERARMMVFVSHDLGSIASLCNRAIWMHWGQVHMDGDPQAVIEAYREFMTTGNSFRQAA
ncbi:MAG: ABC transporter ATP-binding protein [Pirellulales bacterium]